MSNIYMYAHGGSGNHGCEAIVRSTIDLLRQIPSDKIVLFSSKPDEDRKYSLDKLCEIVNEKSPYSKYTGAFLSAYWQLKVKNNYVPMDKLEYKNTFKRINRGDIALSVGGDNYCYKDADRYIMLHDLALAQHAKTVLWGCSVEPSLLENPKIAADLSRYSLITARESISYNALKSINPNTVLVPDPAFTLKYEKSDLSLTYGKKDYVGINLSPMVQELEPIPGITIKNYQGLVDYIIRTTDMDVLLIPHVVWNGNDDRIPLRAIYEMYQSSDRVHLVDDQDCMKLKGIISCCRFFIGARTHSTIAAYSTGVPTIAVGYSVKAKGIALDLFGTDENYVIPVQSLSNEKALVSVFQWLTIHEVQIKYILQKVAKENILVKYQLVLEKIENLCDNI